LVGHTTEQIAVCETSRAGVALTENFSATLKRWLWRRYIDEQPVIMQEISSDSQLGNVGHFESPRERTFDAQVELQLILARRFLFECRWRR